MEIWRDGQRVNTDDKFRAGTLRNDDDGSMRNVIGPMERSASNSLEEKKPERRNGLRRGNIPRANRTGRIRGPRTTDVVSKKTLPCRRIGATFRFPTVERAPRIVSVFSSDRRLRGKPSLGKRREKKKKRKNTNHDGRSDSSETIERVFAGDPYGESNRCFDSEHGRHTDEVHDQLSLDYGYAVSLRGSYHGNIVTNQ